MQKTRFFLKGSTAETVWLNKQARRGHQLTAVRGNHYQFKAVSNAPGVLAEYLPPATLSELTEVFHPLTTFTFNNGQMAVAYSPVTVNSDHRVVSADEHYRLAVYRRAREVALNWMNGLVIGIWLLMCIGVIGSTQVTATPLLTRLLLGSFGVGSFLIVLSIVICASAALNFHRHVCRLIQVTGEDEGTWKPTFHVILRNQRQEPDTSAWADLGKWELAMQNHQGDYYFNLQTNLSEAEIKRSLLKMINKQDFDVMSWLGLYPL